MRLTTPSARRIASALVAVTAAGAIGGVLHADSALAGKPSSRTSDSSAAIAAPVALAPADATPPVVPAGNPAPGGLGSLFNTAKIINADDFWAKGYTGKGIDVAVVDTGVARVPGLTNNVVNGPDLSLDANGDSLDGIDGYGHGTHMAGIIAGRPYSTEPSKLVSYASTTPIGIAPGARIVDVKVGAADGAVDVSQIIAAIDWVVQNRNTEGRNIRVLNLSVGTTGTQDYKLDPVAFAVEQAWNKGIVVVVSAGNDGVGSDELDNPAYDPRIIAVGASDHMGTFDTTDDMVADFSSRGTIARRPDFVAPGRSIESARVPGGYVDTYFPESILSATIARGSGSSQAAAVTSGAVALLLERYPDLNPDQVKALLKNSGRSLKRADGTFMDAFMKQFDLAKTPGHVDNVRDPKLQGWYDQAWLKPATGLGTLDGARGEDRLTDGVTTLQGEIDLLGRKWVASEWATAAANASTWNGRAWRGELWANTSWSGRTWTGAVWSGRMWKGTWTGAYWSGTSWGFEAFNGRAWSGRAWSGSRWSGRMWKSIV